jgi:hypothetical protein
MYLGDVVGLAVEGLDRTRELIFVLVEVVVPRERRGREGGEKGEKNGGRRGRETGKKEVRRGVNKETRTNTKAKHSRLRYPPLPSADNSRNHKVQHTQGHATTHTHCANTHTHRTHMHA